MCELTTALRTNGTVRHIEVSGRCAERYRLLDRAGYTLYEVAPHCFQIWHGAAPVAAQTVMLAEAEADTLNALAVTVMKRTTL